MAANKVPYMLGTYLTGLRDTASQADTRAASLRQELGSFAEQETDVPYALPPDRSALAAGLMSLLSNTASAVSGNPLYAQGNARQLEQERGNSMDAQRTKAGLDYQSAHARRQNLFNMKSSDLQRQYDVAKEAGNHVYAGELLDQQIQIQDKMAKAQRDFEARQKDLDRKNSLDEANIRAGADKYQADAARGLTGDPHMDRIIKFSKSVSQINELAAAAAHQVGVKDPKGFQKFLKENPVWGQMDSALKASISDPTPFKDKGSTEPAQLYVQRQSMAGKSPDQIKALVKQHYPNEPIEEAPTTKSTKKPTTRGGALMSEITGIGEPVFSRQASRVNPVSAAVDLTKLPALLMEYLNSPIDSLPRPSRGGASF